jgi:hypothetical protein
MDTYQTEAEAEADEAAQMEQVSHFESVPVKIVNAGDQGANVNVQASDYGAFYSITVGATDAPRQILPFDENRHRAVILVGGIGPVFIGTVAQVNASPPLGFLLPTGMQIEVRNNQAVWMAPDGTHTATVSVLAERWGESSLVWGGHHEGF